MVLGVHTFDLCHNLFGEPVWCFACLTDQGKVVKTGEFQLGADGIGPLAGDRIDAVFGFKANSAAAHFATARPAQPEEVVASHSHRADQADGQARLSRASHRAAG